MLFENDCRYLAHQSLYAWNAQPILPVADQAGWVFCDHAGSPCAVWKCQITQCKYAHRVILICSIWFVDKELHPSTWHIHDMPLSVKEKTVHGIGRHNRNYPGFMWRQSMKMMSTQTQNNFSAIPTIFLWFFLWFCAYTWNQNYILFHIIPLLKL